MDERIQARGGKVGALLTIDEVAKRLRVPRSWVYDRRHRGQLPFPVVRIGGPHGRLRFPEEALESYIESQVEPGS